MPRALIERFYQELWNAADERIAAEILHSQLIFRGSLGQETRERVGFLGYLRGVHAALGDDRCRIDDLVATDTRAAARMQFEGVHRGRLLRVEPTGGRAPPSSRAVMA